MSDNSYRRLVESSGRAIPNGSCSIHRTQETSSPPPSSSEHTPIQTPGSANSYHQLTVEDLILLPTRDGLPKLDPLRRDNACWFGIDNKISRSIADTIKGFFTEPHVNWTQTPDHIRKMWFKSFAQKWQWDIGIHELVKKEFEIKAKRRLVDSVCDWKRRWAARGDEAKPNFITTEVWNGLVAYWNNPQAQHVAAKCSTSRKANVDGHGPHVHTSGQMSYAERRLKMTKERGGVLPTLTAVFAATHKRKDGTFVDERSAKVVKAVETKLAARQTQSSQGSTSQLLTLEEEDRIFEEIAPKTKRGKTIGMGTIREIQSAPEPTFKVELDEAKMEISNLKTTVDKMMAVLGSIAPENPLVAAALTTQGFGEIPTPDEPASVNDDTPPPPQN